MSIIERDACTTAFLPRRPLAALMRLVWTRVRRAALLRAQRRSVVHMARLDDHLLADIGLTRHQVTQALHKTGARLD